MKQEYVGILVIYMVFIGISISGCSGSPNPVQNTSNVNITITSIVTPSVTESPIPDYWIHSLEISINEPSILFRTDNISWYEYIVTYKRDNETSHEKLVVDYLRYADIDPTYTGAQTNIQQISAYNGTMYQLAYSGNSMSGSILSGIQNGVKSLHSLALTGRDSLLNVRKLDISTRFDAVTDHAMKPVSNGTIMYNGESYACVVYEVHVDNDTFIVWHNASLPVPPKVVAYYESPAIYVYPGKGGNITGPCTYDLLDWSADRAAIPGWYEAPVLKYP